MFKTLPLRYQASETDVSQDEKNNSMFDYYEIFELHVI